jgi:uncharacterized membrane protein
VAQKIPFRHRAHEVSRVEAFSDVIFGFSISLLVVSLEAPKTFAEMMEMLRGFLPFAICFWLFIDIWFEHHDFFKRYALQDRPTLILNTFLLFVILFYVYPLKFVFTMFAQGLFGERPELPRGGPEFLFTIYGLGVMAVFWIIAAMYAHALHLYEELELNAVEILDTKESFYDNVFMGLFGLLSLIIAHTPLRGFAGGVYFLIAIPKTFVPWHFGIRRRKLEESLAAA